MAHSERSSHHHRRPLPPARTLLAVCLGSLLAASACGFDAGTRDLGRTSDLLTSSGEPDAGSSSASGFEPRAITDFIGDWVGEVEDPFVPNADGSAGVYRFPSGSSAIHLVIGREGAAIRFGDAPVPPVLDLDRGYPEDVAYMSEALQGSLLLPPLEGFEYLLQAQNSFSVMDLGTLSDVLTDGVLRFYYAQNQFVRDWCSFQTPQQSAIQASGYSCLGAAGWGSNLNECGYMPLDAEPPSDSLTPEDLLPVDCGKLFLCETSLVPICECDSERCLINERTQSGLFLQVAGDELVGSFAQGVFARPNGFVTPLGTVRFRRVE